MSNPRYTMADIAKAGDALAQSAEDAAYAATRAVLMRQTIPGYFRRPTRRDRIRARFQEWRARLAMAGDVLRGRHDCGDDW